PILGWVPVVVGLMAAAGNYAVARSLRAGAKEDAAIQLAYVHNLGDAWISFGPVVAGLLVIMTGLRVIDVVVALALAGLILVPTVRTVATRGSDLIWPEGIACAETQRPGLAS
ncbi:MAG: cation transporter, partial [bacterium]